MALIAMAGRALVHIRLQLWRMLEASIEERQSRSSFLNEYFVPKIRQAQKAGGGGARWYSGRLGMLTFGGVMLFCLLNHLELDHAVSLDSDHPLDDDELLPILSASLRQMAKPVKSRCKKPKTLLPSLPETMLWQSLFQPGTVFQQSRFQKSLAYYSVRRSRRKTMLYCWSPQLEYRGFRR